MTPPLQYFSRALRASIAVVLLAIVTSVVARAQTVPIDPFSAGRTFVIAFPDTVGNERDDVFVDTRLSDAAVVMIYSAVPNTVRVTGGNGLANWSTALDSARFTTIDLMRPEFRDPFGPVSPDPKVQRKNAFRIETQHPVIVYCFLQTIWGAEAWTPLPVEAWGTEYYAAAFPGDIVRNVYYVNKAIRTRSQPAPSEIVLVAAYDNTQISIFPNGPVLSPPSVITLRANEAFQLRSFVDTIPRTDVYQPDLGGSYIVATKPIGVISGNTRTAIIDERGGLTKNALKSMAFEWLAPADEHGREFAYTPVFDDLRVTGSSGELLSTKRPGEMIRVFGTASDQAQGWLTSTVTAPYEFNVTRASVHQIRLDGKLGGRYLTTSGPVQAVTAPAGVIRSAAGGGYDTWAALMSELVPREQWTSFAPFLAITVPVGMRHYINIVTDTVSANSIFVDGRLFRMNMGAIPGSDLCWGTMEVPLSYHHHVEGRNGAKFTAMMYGLLPGSEKSINNRYREYLALSYGHALAPARRALRMRESLTFDSARDCRGLSIGVRTAGGAVETIRRVWLDSASNVTLATPLDGPTITPASFRVEVIDPNLDARGVLKFEDRAGTVHSVAYVRSGELASIAPSQGVFFGEAMSGDTITREISIRNRSSVALTVRSIRFASGRLGFALADTFAPRALAPDETLTLTVRATPTGGVGPRIDTVIVALECSELRASLSASVVEPCIELGDLDFGTVEPGLLSTRSLTVCNRGRGRLQLTSVSGDSMIVWDDPSFSVNPVFFEMLRTSVLGPGECVSVEVFFRASRSGSYRTIARMQPAAGACRDSSTWRAVVTQTTGVAFESDASRSFDVVVDGRSVAMSSGVDEGTVSIHDGLGRRVAGPFRMRRGDPGALWDASRAPAGVYFASLTVDGVMIVERIMLR